MKSSLKDIAKSMRKQALFLALKSGKKGSHLGGGLSAIEIFTCLYNSILKFDSKNPTDPSRDRLIVSKGHCVLAYYTALKDAGFMTEEEWLSFETNQSPFHGHATRDLAKGIEFSGGSLSMGITYAIGVAIACKKQNLNNRVFAIVGDGECDEGLVWEALMSAAHYHLNNFTLIVDCNSLQYDGPTAEVMNTSSLKNKFIAFGIDAVEVDGHDCEALCAALQHRNPNMPTAVVAKTVKGKGVSFMENQKQWHHSTLSEEQYQQALSEIELA